MIEIMFLICYIECDRGLIGVFLLYDFLGVVGFWWSKFCVFFVFLLVEIVFKNVLLGWV